MRKSVIALVAVVSLGFVSACGASGGSDSSSKDATTTTKAPKATTTTTEASKAVAVTAWADGFCTSFSDWLDEIKAASSDVGTKITPGDIAGAKAAIADLFDSASSSTQNLIASMEDAGSPDIDNGDQLVQDLIAKFQAFDDAAQAAKSDTEALATTDATKFQSDAQELTTRFQTDVNTVADSFAEIDTKYPSKELNAALSSSCNF